MTFSRLLRADWIAFAAALALLLVMAMDWYGTAAGDEARRIEKLANPQGALGGEVEREVKADAKVAAEKAEKNAWQADDFVDRLILAGLLATMLLAVGSAYLRAAGKRFEPPWTPSAIMSLAATGTGILLGLHIVVSANDDLGTRIKAGAPLGAILLGTIALAGVSAMRAEESGKAWRRGERRTEPETTTAEGAT